MKSLLLVLLLSSTTSFAQGRMGPSSPTINSVTTSQERIAPTFGAGVASQAQGFATTNRTTAFNDLLGSTGPSPEWPKFPRMWFEEYQLHTVRTNTSWSPRLFALNGGVEIDYKYAVKTTLVLITSLEDKGEGAAERTQKQIVNAQSYEMLRADPETKRVYPIIRDHAPMIGFCSFELSLNISNGQTFGIEALGFGTRGTMENVRGVSQTVFSKFFSVPKGLSVQNIFNNYCNDVFAKHVRELAEKNFVPVVVEETFLNSPKNQCHPNPKDSAAGDYECLNWFQQFDSIYRHVAVPRCKTVKGGFNRCELRGKERTTCPIYKDKAGKRYATYVRGRTPITHNNFAIQCDAGLHCSMYQEPKELLNGLIELKGRAVCKAPAKAKAR